ncbi:MAG TPA: hypothetical protein DDZ51_10755 [Planctomycetaceae bacterium]|nr:hypothetical protein [Planctomycetaceae bacterium]
MSPHEEKVFKLVVKVGGSLLTRPGLGPAIAEWLDRRLAGQPAAQVNLIVGGGAMIDAFRQLDAVHGLDPVSLHWQCVAALRHTGEIVASLVPNCSIIGSQASFNSHRQSTTAVGRFAILPDAFYHRDSGDCLPCDWQATSDSIAALLAQKIDADQLVLLKSCNIPENIDLREAARRGIVDPLLPTMIDPHRVEVIELRWTEPK